MGRGRECFCEGGESDRRSGKDGGCARRSVDQKNLPAERRAIVLKELQVWASEPESRKRHTKMPTDPWLSTIIVLEAQSHLRVQAGKLKPQTQQ